MKVIVCGAGSIGSSIAYNLASENNDVTVIDQSPKLEHKIADSLDVQAMVGCASHPDILEAAGARNADMIIAVTYSNEVGMIAWDSTTVIKPKNRVVLFATTRDVRKVEKTFSVGLEFF